MQDMKSKLGKLMMVALLSLLTVFTFATPASPTNATPTNILEDENLKVTFSTLFHLLNSSGTFVKVVFTNKTNVPIKIIWDETQFEDNLGDVVGVIHIGERYIHAELHQPPTIIPPNKTIENIMIPQTHIHFISSLSWTVDSISLNKPVRYVFITYEINGKKYSLYGEISLKTKKKTARNSRAFFGLDLWTIFGSAELNDKGEITIVRGINNFIGYQEKRFFSPAKVGQFNAYLTWGTAILIVPLFIGIGTEYIAPNGFYFDASIVDLVPTIATGWYF